MNGNRQVDPARHQLLIPNRTGGVPQLIPTGRVRLNANTLQLASLGELPIDSRRVSVDDDQGRAVLRLESLNDVAGDSTAAPIPIATN